MSIKSLNIENIAKYTCTFSLLFYLFILFYKPIEIEDISWHLKTGEWIVEHSQVPHEDIFPYSDEKIRWVFPEWIGSTFFYLIYKSGGETGLKLFRAVYFLGFLGFLFIYARRKIPYPLLILLLYILGHCFNAPLRPLIFNLIFIQLFLINLLKYQETLNIKNLLYLPLLGILWANIHLGSFVYGNALILIFLFSAIISFFNSWTYPKLTPQNHPDSFKQVKHLFITFLLFQFVFLITPYGVEGFLNPFQTFLNPKSSIFLQHGHLIYEMQPPIFLLGKPGFYFDSLIVISILFLILNRKNNFSYILLFVSSLFLFLTAQRASEFFNLTSFSIITQCANNFSLNQAWEAKRFFKICNIMIYILITTITVAGVIHNLNQKIYYHGQIIRAIHLKYIPQNPNSSIAFLKNNNITGIVLTNDAVGGHIIWSAYPGLKPIIDGRQFNQGTYLKIIKTPSFYVPLAEQQWGITIALLDSSLGSSSYKLMEYFKNDPHWALVFLDGSYLIFLKKSAYSLEARENALQTTLAATPISPDTIKSLKFSLSKPIRSGLSQYLDAPPYFIDSLEEGVNLFALGFEGEGLNRLAKALSVSHEGMARDIGFKIIKILEDRKSPSLKTE